MYRQIDSAESYITKGYLGGKSVVKQGNMHQIGKSFFNKDFLLQLYGSIEKAEQKLSGNYILDAKDNISTKVSNILN